MRNLFLFSFAILIIALPLQGNALPSRSSGQNDFKPVRRADLRYKYEEAAVEKKHIATSRFDEFWKLSGDREASIRIDLPVVWLEEDHGHGTERESGLGDMLIQGVMIHEWDDFRLGYGARVYPPTASDELLGAEEWSFGPGVGASHDLPALGEGSFVSFITRYRVPVSGTEGAMVLDGLNTETKLNIHLPHHFFADLRLRTFTNLDDEEQWDIPLGLALGKVFSEKILVSVEPELFLLSESVSADYAVEARVAYFF